MRPSAGRLDLSRQRQGSGGRSRQHRLFPALPRLLPRRSGRAGFGLVVAAWAILAGCAGFAGGGPADPQDACTIGAIDPLAYRELAADVAARTPYDWKAVFAREEGGAWGEASAEITEALKIAIQDQKQTDAKLAAMHALMRMIGAEMRYPSLGYVFGKPEDERVDLATYGYRLDVNRVGLRRPFNRWAHISISFHLSDHKTDVREVHGVFVNMPNLYEHTWPGWRKPEQLARCPLLPADIAAFRKSITRS